MPNSQMKTVLEIKGHKSLSKLGAYLFGFFKYVGTKGI